MRHLIIPDCQVRPSTPTQHLTWIGKYIVNKQPEVIVCLGDFADMHSLSVYDQGRKAGEGARYKDDVDSSISAMSKLMTPLHKYNKKLW